MSELLAEIRAVIDKKGPITLASYMELALHHPKLGYYRRRDPIGRQGDFTTAPEISQMFGEMLGLWCADIWREMGKPKAFALLELGPGRGTMMQDALRATAKIQGFHDALNLYFIESNETLRLEQQRKLVDQLPCYIQDLTELPPMPTFVLANEFFDVLPIRQFEKTFQGWFERMVSIDKEKLGAILGPLEPMLVQLIPVDRREANPGTVYEVSLPALTIARSLTKHIMQHSGVALIIDYGFVEPSGQPTLQAISEHQFTQVLARPGEVDLTAHVDFAALRHIALGQGANVSGPVGQGDFLSALGIELRAVQLKQRTTPKEAADIDAGLKRLIDPSQMGTLFKAMAIASPQLTSLPGF